MMYTDFAAGGKEYKLRLTTRSVLTLEKTLGCNPIMIFGLNGEKFPTVGEMVAILHASLQALQHKITMDEACKIFDDYIEDGNTSVDFVKVIFEVYKVSGLINEDHEEKNA